MYKTGQFSELTGISIPTLLFLDTFLNKVFNADINGAVNHIKIATAKSFEWLKKQLV